MIRVVLGQTGRGIIPKQLFSSSRSSSVQNEEQACSQSKTTWHLQGFSILKEAGSQLTGAEELIIE